MGKNLTVASSLEVPATGYELVEGLEYVRETEVLKPNISRLFITRRRPIRDTRRYDPLALSPALFRNFADQVSAPSGALSFANSYGWLRNYTSLIRRSPSDELEMAESVSLWLSENRLMRTALTLWDSLHSGEFGPAYRALRSIIQGDETRSITLAQPPQDGMRDADSGEPLTRDELIILFACLSDDRDTVPISDGAWEDLLLRGNMTNRAPGSLLFRVCLHHLVNCRVPRDTRVWLQINPEWSYDLVIVPGDLITALWLQFARALSGNRTYRKCDTCGTWFEVSPDLNRTNRRFCSNACRSRFYRDKKREAKVLCEQGYSVSDIASRLETEPRVVEGWLSREKGFDG